MQINACLVMGVLRHYTRDHRNLEQIQFMSQAKYRHGIEPRIAEDDLTLGIGCRVPIQHRLYIRVQKLSHSGDAVHELDRDSLGFLLYRLRGLGMKLIRVAQRDLDLFRQIDNDIIHDRTDRSVHIENTKRRIGIQVVARIYDLEQLPDDLPDHISVRFSRRGNAVDRPAALVIPQDLLDYIARLIFKTELSLMTCHTPVRLFLLKFIV